MKTDICNDLPKCRIVLILTALFILFGNNILFAQTTPIYQSGNVAVYQYSQGWEIMHGNNLVGYGDGVLDIDNLPPAFKELIDFYAVEPVTKVNKRPKTKAAPTLSEVYGPLIKTKWFQTSPYNDLFPTLKDANGEDEHTLVGCTSVSSGMLMNFFHYCKPFEVKGTNKIKGISSALSSPFMSNVKEVNEDGTDYVTFDYDFAKQYSTSLFTPDFEAMKYDVGEISKYLLAIAFVQQAGFGLDVTLTTRDKQMNAIKNLYGYDYVNYSYTKYPNLDLTYNDVIADAIKKGWPVIVGGQTSEGSGHSFMIDGIDGDMFHFEYGWGGKDNGWFQVPAKYSNNYNIIIAHPDIENFAYLKPDPKYLYIKGVDNDFSQKIDMEQNGSNKWSYRQKDLVDVPAGTFEFYFEYEDGTTIAPYVSSPIELDYYTNPFSCTGLFTTNAAKITLEKGYKLNFWHMLNMGEIMVEAIDLSVAISGKVLDMDDNPVAGAMVTYYDYAPEIYEEDSYEITTNNWSVPKYPSWRTNTFTTSANCLAGMDIRIYSKKGDPGDLIVAILNYSKNEVWKKQIPYNQVVTGGWMHIDFDETVFVVPNEPYYVALASEEWVSGVNSYYTSCDGTDDHNIAFRIYSSNIPFVRTGSDGTYSYTVDKYSSLTLTAFSDDKLFNSIDLDNVTENLTDKNLVQTGFTYIDITGKVLDKDGNPIEGAIITAAEAKPVAVIDQNNPTPSTNGLRVKTEGVIKEFIPKKKYLTELDLMFFRKGDPGNLHISIVDALGNTLWNQDYGTSTIPNTTNTNFVKFMFDNLIAVTPDDNYYIKISADVCEDDNRCNYYYDETNKQMVYQVWGVDDLYTVSGADGKYTYRTDRGFTGSLNAYYDDKTFNSITFTDQYVNISEMNLVENAADIVLNAEIQSIDVKPTKTEYYLGEVFNPADMVVTAEYTNGAKKVVATGYEYLGFDSETVGEKTITVTYSERFTQFKVTVKSNIFTITYKTDDKVYKTASVKMGDAIAAIDAPTKEGCTFAGWNPALPDKMPAKDLTVTAKFDFVDYTITYYIDDKIDGEVEKYHLGDNVTMRTAPTKEGYTFSGWDVSITTMPAENVAVKGTFTKDNPTPVANINSENVAKIWSNDGVIYIETLPDTDYQIIDLSGRVIKSSSTTATREEINLNRKGVFLVIVNGNSYKVLLTK